MDNLPVNYNQPLIMHVDLNSCFAIIEQQANPLIRNKPVAIAAYDTPRGIVIASSYEAKALGIKLGVNVREARLLCKDVIVMTPDPDKYFDAHGRFKKVLYNYTDAVVPKSVDEFVINFRGSQAVARGKSLEEIGRDIKQDVKKSLGEYVTINVGIGPNRFLAKLAAGLNKPDGLDIIDGNNLRDVYSRLALTDLPGINTRYEARLNVAGIYSPLQFLDASAIMLKKRVFGGINGYYWYLRLRGHEVDNVNFGRKSFGQQYALGDKTSDREKLSRLLMKLCEKTGRRLRANNFIAEGIYLWLSFENRTYWSKGKLAKADIYSTQEIYLHAQRLMNQAILDLCKVPSSSNQINSAANGFSSLDVSSDTSPSDKTVFARANSLREQATSHKSSMFPARVTNIGVTVYKLKAASPEQLGLFDGTRMDTKSLARAADIVNDKYGEFTLVPATMANMQDVILKRVAFGNVK